MIGSFLPSSSRATGRVCLGRLGRSEPAGRWHPVSQETGHGTEGTIHEVLEAVRMRMTAIARYLAALGATALLAAGISACSTSNSAAPSSSSPAASGARPSRLTIAPSFAIGDLDSVENGYWGDERCMTLPVHFSAPDGSDNEQRCGGYTFVTSDETP